MKNVYVLSAQLGSLPVFNLMGVFKTREEAEEQAKNENYPYSEIYCMNKGMPNLELVKTMFKDEVESILGED